jgi:hypothetical protein
MIYFALPILILFGIRTTLIETEIPGTDVISSHLSFYLYGYELLIAGITFWWLSKKREYIIWFGISTSILLGLVYISDNTWLSFMHVLRLVNLSGMYLWTSRIDNPKKIQKFLQGLGVALGGILFIAIIQFVIQRSVGIGFLHEPIVAVDQAGVAKVSIGGLAVLRPYSILPHPNILGWVGVTTIAFLMGIKFPRHALRIYILSQIGYILLDHMHWTYPVVQYMTVMFFGLLYPQSKKKMSISSMNQNLLVIFSTGLILLSFSRLAWGIFVALSGVFAFLDKKMFHVEHFPLKKYLAYICIVPILFFSTFWRFIQLLQETSVGLRAVYLQRSISLIRQDYIWGVGIGNYVDGIVGIYVGGIPTWQFEPVHNVFVLVFSETGLVGLGIIFAWWYVYKKNFK